MNRQTMLQRKSRLECKKAIRDQVNAENSKNSYRKRKEINRKDRTSFNSVKETERMPWKYREWRREEERRGDKGREEKRRGERKKEKRSTRGIERGRDRKAKKLAFEVRSPKYSCKLAKCLWTQTSENEISKRNLKSICNNYNNEKLMLLEYSHDFYVCYYTHHHNAIEKKRLWNDIRRIKRFEYICEATDVCYAFFSLLFFNSFDRNCDCV